MYDLNLTQETFKDWIRDNFKPSELKDIARRGGGFGGLIDYRATSALYAKYHVEMWKYLFEEATFHEMSCIELISMFEGSIDICDHITFAKLMTWYTAERPAAELINFQYD